MHCNDFYNNHFDAFYELGTLNKINKTEYFKDNHIFW